MQIAIATRNKKKIEEIKMITEGMPISLLSLDDFPGCPEVEETEDTFEGNAVLKSKAVSAFTKTPALSDDSGLVVDSLGGKPGVLSARYAGDNASDADNLNKLLLELKDIPKERRTARFVCVVALSMPDGATETFEGTVEGVIGFEPIGRKGFGYDPVFYPEGHDRTFAEMTQDEKNSMSHRGRALLKLREFLKTTNIAM